jgi:hypothetical protein
MRTSIRGVPPVPRVNLKQDRQAQEIGAAIVGAWLKALPSTHAAKVTGVDGLEPLRITVDNISAFAAGNAIALRINANTGIRGVTVGPITPGSQTFNVLDLNGNAVNYRGNDLLGASVSKVEDLNLFKNELEVVLGQIVEAEVEVVCDPPTKLTVVVPSLPEGVITRQDLFDYLGKYHNNSQGRHYHDELASAVLFGCR